MKRMQLTESGTAGFPAKSGQTHAAQSANAVTRSWRSAGMTQEGICHNDAPIFGSAADLPRGDEGGGGRACESNGVYLGNFRKPLPDDIVEGRVRKPRGAPPPKFGPTAISFEQGLAGESLIVGTPSELRDHLRDYMATTSGNYYGVAFQWGNLTHAEASGSMDLFVREVMPLAGELSVVRNVA